MASDAYNGQSDRWPVNHDPVDNPRLGFAIPSSAYSDTQDLTNSAGSNLPSYAKALYIGDNSTKNLGVVFAGDKSNNGAGTIVTLLNVPAGLLNIQVRRITTATTMATNSIIALMD